jgi:hypothetical protein
MKRWSAVSMKGQDNRAALDVLKTENLWANDACFAGVGKGFGSDFPQQEGLHRRRSTS